MLRIPILLLKEDGILEVAHHLQLNKYGSLYSDQDFQEDS